MKLRVPPITVVLLSAFILNGCHSLTRVALPDSTPPPPNAAVFAQLKAGDDVRVTLRTGEKVTFTLAEVQAEGLVAKDGRRYAFSDTRQIERRHISGTKITIGVACVVALLSFMAYFVTHFGP
jgi:hypothetical protein